MGITAAALVAASVAGSVGGGVGCGGSSDTATGGDSGGDGAPLGSGSDAASGDGATATNDGSGGACASGLDITQLPVPTSGPGAACLGCVKSSCPTALMHCNGDCTCKAAVVALGLCLAGGGDLISCATKDLKDVNSGLQSEFTLCAFPCLPTCTAPPPSTDAGGATDAAADSSAPDSGAIDGGSAPPADAGPG